MDTFLIVIITTLATNIGYNWLFAGNSNANINLNLNITTPHNKSDNKDNNKKNNQIEGVNV